MFTPNKKKKHSKTMKPFTILMLALLFITSCQSSDEPEVLKIPEDRSDITNDDPTNNSDDQLFKITIDDSDLAQLPEDIGGNHTAMPLSTTNANYGYYVYTPNGYLENGPEYPLLIFLHGWSPDLGNEPLEHVLSGGPPKLIETDDWNPSFPFIVVSPQLKTQYWAPDSVHQFIEYLMDTYQVNPSRIYLTGLSLGGGGCWYYVGEVDDNFAAAIVPISASGAEHLVENLKQVPIWAFHGAKDNSVAAYDYFGSVPMVKAVNDENPTVEARVTVYPSLGHDAWTATYSGNGHSYNQSFDEFKVDIYDWMLMYRKETE